ncbi:MAG: translation initiation factor IF-3 [Planctomycetes bacterium]|nr:translation initiation factor IF-3 [Planctomycetota bacterium]
MSRGKVTPNVDRLRRNNQIRISPIRVIDQDEQQVGIIDTDKARQMAMEAGMDLVEVAPNARPPVCRIMDYGKWLYEQKKKEKVAKSHRHEVTLKEVRMRPKTDPHDMMIKVNQARGFLAKGHKVQFTLRFRGREMVHLDLGRDTFNAVKEQLADIGKVERDFKMEGRRLTMVLMPAGKIEKKDARPQPVPAGAPAAAEAAEPAPSEQA